MAAEKLVRISPNRGALVLAVGFLILLASSVWLFGTVSGATREQEMVAKTQRARSASFIALLDQETALRGFLSTGKIGFLAPYANAQANIEQHFSDLHVTLRNLGATALLPYADEEVRLYNRWHDEVAAPLLADRHRKDALLRQYEGQTLMDHYREDNRALDVGIGEATTDAQRQITIVLSRIAVVTGVLGVTFFFVYIFFSRQRSRMLAENARQRLLYENEKRIADALQGAFVQKSLPVLPDLGFHASYVPAGAEAQVGGDWYDAFVLPDGRILFSIGDVAGHGIEAAVIMSRARQAIIANALHERDPGTVLRKANETLLLQDPKMVTAICGYIDPTDLCIVYATAGHPPPILADRDGEARFLDHDGLPLGILPQVDYPSFTVQARGGSLLVLYTDGVIEHKRDLIDGEQRLLLATRSALRDPTTDPAASVQRAIFGDKPPIDDVAIMTVSFAAHSGANTATVDAFSLNHLAATAPSDVRIMTTAAPATCLAAVLTAAGLVATATPAPAQTQSAISEKISAATAHAQSFVIDIHAEGRTTFDGHITIVRPLRSKSEITIGDQHVTSYLIDGEIYLNIPGMGWQKVPMDNPITQSVFDVAASMKNAQVAQMLDRTTNGKVVGVIAIDTLIPASAMNPLGGSRQHLICSYDKATYLLDTCNGDHVTVAYSHYDDPLNTVTLPPDAAGAAPLTLPSMPTSAPSPAVAPSPSATSGTVPT